MLLGGRIEYLNSRCLYYTESQGIQCPVVGRFNIRDLLYFDESAVAFLQLLDFRRKVI